MTQTSNLPLSGVTVLDLSRVLAGPWASQLLADLGARVIKIERPDAGDDTRGWGPPFAKDRAGRTTDAAYFLATNHNKESVTVNIATPEGAELIRSLAEKADLLVENFKPGGLAKYGLDYDSIAAINPKLVYCSVTGFGQTGPYRDRPGYDYMIQGMAGMMSVTGPPKEPMKAGIAVADLFTGMYASSAMLAALRHAEHTGEGQHLDVSLFDCQLAIMCNQSASYLIAGEIPQRAGNAHASIVPYQVFETTDGHLVLAVGNDGQFEKFCNVVGKPEWALDERFQKNRDRVVNRDTLIPMIAEILKNQDAAYWLSALEAAGVPAGPINMIDQAFAEPQAIARCMTQAAQRDGEPEYRYAPHPVKYSRTPIGEMKAPPQLGAHTNDVLKDLLNMDEQRLKALRASGVIG